MAETPFDSIESAQEYVRLLLAEVENVRRGIQQDMADATRDRAPRRLDALHLVEFKLKHLEQHLSSSLRILNDLRMLRRLLVSDRDVVGAASQEPDKKARSGS